MSASEQHPGEQIREEHERLRRRIAQEYGFNGPADPRVEEILEPPRNNPTYD